MACKKTFFKAHSDVLVCLFLLTATFAVYWQVSSYELINFDDDVYISANQHVRSGLSLASIKWAFTALHESTWQPLVWISFMIDSQLHGSDPGWFHLTSLFLHIANTLLLFFVFRKMTGDLWPSAFVAALFAFHPLHVESVAWVAERKDMLSTFFWMLTLWGYVRYVAHPGIVRLLPALLFSILGLMAKPMLVTLPFVLLLLDFWPLGRLERHASHNSTTISRLFLEKIPFFIFAALSSLLTFFIHQKGGAIVSMDVHPLNIRIANALISCIVYAWKMILPFNLAVFYPYPDSIPWWKTAWSGFLILSASLLTLKALRRRPYLAVGWFWYIGTLVPVIGLVQTGAHAMADRFTYIPLTGLFIIIAWGVPELLAGWSYKKTCLAVITAVLIPALMTITRVQVKYWSDSITLYKHTLNVTADNNVTHHTLGLALFQKGRIREAAFHFNEALRIAPADTRAHNNLGLAMARLGRTGDSIKHYQEALRLNPDYADAHYNLGIALAQLGMTDKAITHYREALRLNPDNVKAHNNIGIALFRKGKIKNAVVHFQKALQIKPDYSYARNNLMKAQAAGHGNTGKKN